MRLFEAYIARRAAHPEEPVAQSYAEVYGTVVYEAAPEGVDSDG